MRGFHGRPFERSRRGHRRARLSAWITSAGRSSTNSCSAAVNLTSFMLSICFDSTVGISEAARREKGTVAGNLLAGAAHTCSTSNLEANGAALFREACRFDLEGIVAKWAPGTYIADNKPSTWIKIRNPNYSQWNDRETLFERQNV
jgi:hypothetical protein